MPESIRGHLRKSAKICVKEKFGNADTRGWDADEHRSPEEAEWFVNVILFFPFIIDTASPPHTVP